MTQSMSSGTFPKKTYYRKQSSPHVTHKESGAFTTAAKNQYSRDYGVNVDSVELGTYRSGQGVPTEANSEEI
jgi:hypothetical protein